MLRLMAASLSACLKSRTHLVLENVALRQQLAVFSRQNRKPKLRWHDRLFWVMLSRMWHGWRRALLLIRPETVIGWHRRGFRLFWRYKSRRRSGRPQVAGELRDLILRMAQENPTWGAPRIHSELLLLGYRIALSTVSRYLDPPRSPSGQTWRSFLENHALDIAAIDMFTVPTVTFRVLYVLVILRHHSRKLVHLAVTANPTSLWLANQLTAAFPYDTAPRLLLRDRDTAFGNVFQARAKALGLAEVRTSYRSPWQDCAQSEG